MRGAKRQSRDKVPRAGLRQEVNPITEPRLFGLLSSTPLSFGVGAKTQRPLATVIVGGLFTTTALTLLILRSFTSGRSRAGKRRKTGQRFPRRKKERSPEEAGRGK